MPTGLAQEGFPGQRKDGKLWGTVSYTKAGYCFQISDGLGEGHGEGLPKKKCEDHPRTMAGSQHSMKFQQEEQ